MLRALWNRLLGRHHDPTVSRGDEAEWRNPREGLDDRAADLESQAHLGGVSDEPRPRDDAH